MSPRRTTYWGRRIERQSRTATTTTTTTTTTSSSSSSSTSTHHAPTTSKRAGLWISLSTSTLNTAMQCHRSVHSASIHFITMPDLTRGHPTSLSRALPMNLYQTRMDSIQQQPRHLPSCLLFSSSLTCLIVLNSRSRGIRLRCSCTHSVVP